MKTIKRVAATAAIMLCLTIYTFALINYTSITAPISIGMILIFITYIIYDIIGEYF